MECARQQLGRGKTVDLIRGTAVSPEVGFTPGRAYSTTYRGALSSLMIVLAAGPVIAGTAFIYALVNRDTQWQLDSWQAHCDNWAETGR
jgi:hypothetical protein